MKFYNLCRFQNRNRSTWTKVMAVFLKACRKKGILGENWSSSTSKRYNSRSRRAIVKLRTSAWPSDLGLSNEILFGSLEASHDDPGTQKAENSQMSILGKKLVFGPFRPKLVVNAPPKPPIHVIYRSLRSFWDPAHPWSPWNTGLPVVQSWPSWGSLSTKWNRLGGKSFATSQN